MRRSLAFLAILACAGPARSSEPGPPPPDLAARAWAVTEAVLARHIEPPTRQEMVLGGLKALLREARVPMPPALARRASGEVETPEALATILDEAWPKGDRPQGGDDLAGAFLEGLGSAVPGGVELLSAKERKVAEQVEGNLYVGIQVALSVDEASKRPAFFRVLEGGPAERAGAKEGDVIEAVDGGSTEGMTLAQVVDRLRGEEGTPVVVRLRRPKAGEAFDAPMVRSILPRKTVVGLNPLPEGRWGVRLDGPAPIGYLKVTEIVGSTPQELRAFAAQLESEGLRALVLDLREVHQAGFHATVLMADALLDGGTIGRVREAGATREIRAEPDALFRGWPMVVLAGKARSAPVAWLCASLRDNRRATVLGPADPEVDPTVRSFVPLPGGEWSIRIATGHLERADGRPLANSSRRVRYRGSAVAAAAPGGGPDPYAAAPDDPPAPPGFMVRRTPPDSSSRAPRPALFVGEMPPPSDPLPEARALLEAALRSTAP